MRDLALAIVVSAVVSAGTAYLMMSREEPTGEPPVQTAGNVSPRQDPTIIHVLITRNGNNCIATTDPWRQSFGEGPIQWVIHRAARNVEQCFRSGETVKIVPKSGNTSPLTPTEPYDARLIRARHENRAYRFFYKVVMASSNGTPLYEMEDPELEIVEVR